MTIASCCKIQSSPVLGLTGVEFGRYRMYFMRRMKSHLLFILLLVFLCSSLQVSAQSSGRSLAEKLGFARDAKLLIVHADDVGVTHSVNAATIKALDTGLVNSAALWSPALGFRKSPTTPNLIP